MAGRKPLLQQPGEGPWNEIIGLILMGIGLVIVIALLSYSSNDPSWDSTGGNTDYRNLIGPIGAKVADGLYQAFGLAAFMVPFTFFLMGWWEFQEPRPDVAKPETLGVFLVIVAITGFLTMFGPDKPSFLSFSWGGFVGRWLIYGPHVGLSNLLGGVGAFVAISILFIIGLLIATPLSVAGFVMNLQPHERDAGTIPALLERFRIWRQNTSPHPVENVRPSQMRQKFDQRRRWTQPNNPVSNVRVRVRPTAGQSQPETIEQEYIEGMDAGTGSPSPEPVISVPNEPAPAPPPALRIPKPPTPANGAASKRTGKKAPEKVEETGDLIHDDATTADEFDNPLPSAQRTVEEMMATASVKRTDAQDPHPRKTKVADLVRSVSRAVANYKLPSTEMLTPPAQRPELEEAELMERAKQLAEKCAEFNVSGQVKQISPGPVVTTFEFKPDPGVKYSRIVGLVDDLCLGLKAESVRIDRIPGKSTVGIEVPNNNREIIRLREVVESKRYHDSHSKLTLALGKTIDGSNYVADLSKMPHL